MITKILPLILYSSIVYSAPHTKVCEDYQTICFAHYHSGEEVGWAWDAVVEADRYDVRLLYEDGTIEDLGQTEVPSFTYIASESKGQIFQARSVRDTPYAVSSWGSIDNPEQTQDGRSWLIMVRPAPPTATFGIE